VTPSGGHSQFFAELRARPRPPPRVDFVEPASDVQTVQLREGVTLRANQNPFNDLYHLELRFGVGTEHTRELELLAQYLTRIGSRRFPGEQLRRRLFELSTTLTVTAELDRFVVRLQGPQQHMEAGARAGGGPDGEAGARAPPAAADPARDLGLSSL
jgi:hypothetical protein